MIINTEDCDLINAVNRLSDALRPHARACWPKEQHDTRGAAEAQMRSILKRDLAKDPKRIHVYRCPECKAFHVGHAK